MPANLTTFSFPLRTFSAGGNAAPRLGGSPSANRSPFLLHRFHGDEQNPLVQRWCDSQFMADQQSPWPLVLYGPSGVGKSALAETLACRLDIPCKTMTADEFRRQFLAAVATRSIKSFREKMYDGQMLLIDNLSLPGDEVALIREFVQFIDFYRQNQRPVIVTALKAPWSMSGVSPPLRSRLSEGLVIEVKRPGLAARRAIVAEVLHHLDLDVQPDDFEWLVSSLPATAPLIKHGLSKVALATTASTAATNRTADQTRKQLTRRDLKKHLPTGAETTVDSGCVHEIVKLVAKHFGQRVSELLGKSRRQEVVRARSVAMYLSRQLLSATFREAGELIGKRDPSTARHACRQIGNGIASDPGLADAINQITARFTWIQENKNRREDNLSIP